MKDELAVVGDGRAAINGSNVRGSFCVRYPDKILSRTFFCA